MKQRFIFLLLLIVLGVPGLKAQDKSNLKPHFFEVWTGITLKKEISKKFRLEFEDQFRISESLGSLRLNLYELGLNYHVAKGLNIKAMYRFSFRNNTRNTKRFSFDLSYKLKIKSLKTQIKYRARFQNTQVTYTGESIDFFRNKLTLTKKITEKWSGYSSYEIAFNLSDDFEQQSNRFVLGAKYAVNKRWQLKAFGQYDQDVHGKYKPTRTVYGLMGIYSFK